MICSKGHFNKLKIKLGKNEKKHSILILEAYNYPEE